MAFRYDRTSSIVKFERTPSGGLRLDARPSRVGVQTYKNLDGSIRREYRPASEVHAPESLASFKGAPVTLLHPVGETVNPENYSRLAKGVIPEPARADGLLVATSVDVNAADAIAGVESREYCELSVGYHCDEDWTPGVSPEGEAYDLVQKNIRVNHVALLPKGGARGGSDCRLRVDSASAISVDMLIKIDGVEYEAGSDSAKAAIKRLEDAKAKAETEATTARTEAATQKTRADSASDPKEIAKRVAFRASLIAQARGTKLGPKYLTDEAEAVATDDDTIIRAVVAQLVPELAEDAKAADHLTLMVLLKAASKMSKPAEPETETPAVDATAAPAGTAFDSVNVGRGDPPKAKGPAVVGLRAEKIEDVKARANQRRADAWQKSRGAAR